MMLTILWAKIWKYVAALGALLLAVGAIFLKGRSDGKQTEEVKTQAAEAKAEVAEQTTAIVESRHDTDTKVESLPEAPAQAVATAVVDSASGKLRDDGWVRD
jgi:hypothetical protein